MFPDKLSSACEDCVVLHQCDNCGGKLVCKPYGSLKCGIFKCNSCGEEYYIQRAVKRQLKQHHLDLALVRERIKPASAMIATCYHGEVVGVKADGTVITTESKRTVSTWKDIIAVAAADRLGLITGNHNHLVGLKTDGTVVHNSLSGQPMEPDWRDIIAISVWNNRVIGLKKDGTVLQMSSDTTSDSILEGWKDVAVISKGGINLAALKTDGSVLITDEYLQSVVSNWTNENIIAVESGYNYIVGLRLDGTVIAEGRNNGTQRDVSKWNNIVSIAAGVEHIVGLKIDGTVVAVGDNFLGQCNTQKWTDVIAVAASKFETIALKEDGTVVRTGEETNENNINTWKLFDSLESLAQIRTKR